MSAEMRWQIVETVKALLIGGAVLVGMYALGLDIAGCPRC